jgi:epoxyqueuosine reductase
MHLKLGQLRAAVEGSAPGVETCAFVDTGPVVERAFARFSGIGWMGKNTCIINQEKGSWFFLGVILTSLELAPDLPAPDRCGSCTACIQACPTGALVESYVMDASRCISYFTIELKGSIPEQFRPMIGANLFGCDICQDVCPWNGVASPQLYGRGGVDGQPQNTRHQPSASSDQQSLSTQRQSSDRRYVEHPATTKVPQFHPMTVAPIHPALEDGDVRKQLTTDHGPRTLDTASLSLFNPPLDVLVLISEDDFRRIFAHAPIKRAKSRGWLRNLCVVMGNSGEESFVPWLEQAAQHSDAIVREHAAWALDRLRNK